MTINDEDYIKHQMSVKTCACGKEGRDEVGNVLNGHQCQPTDMTRRIGILEIENDELKEKLELAIRLIEEARCPHETSKHHCCGPWCNGVHADSGACEGAYSANDLYLRLVDKAPWKIPDIVLEAPSSNG